MYLMKRPYLKIYTNDLDIKIICAILLPYGFTHNQIVELYKTTYLYNIQIISTINLSMIHYMIKILKSDHLTGLSKGLINSSIFLCEDKA
jgi:hypothetical protein